MASSALSWLADNYTNIWLWQRGVRRVVRVVARWYAERVLVRAGQTEVRIDETAVAVGWRGKAVLRGALEAQPRPVSARLSARADGAAVYLDAEVLPDPEAPAVAAWIVLRWLADDPGELRAWVPHLRPGREDVIADHSFRSPVAAVEGARARLVLLPDVDRLLADRPLPAAFDLDLEDPNGPRVACGLRASVPHGHTWFRGLPAGGATQPLRFGLRLLLEPVGEMPIESSCARWAWRGGGARWAQAAHTQALPFIEHAQRGYEALFGDEWFTAEIGGRHVGGPTYYSAGGTAVFFQAWFHALRSAIGLALAGRRLGRPDYLARARCTANLADTMPPGPMLPTFYDHENGRWWGVGDDLIFAWVGRDAHTLRFFHLPDACETARWMLVWHEMVEPRPSFVQRATDLGRFLAQAQQEDGSIPSYFDCVTGAPGERLRSCAQSAVAGPLLLWAGEEDAAVRLGRFLCREIVPTRRYFDYETFLSCAYKPFDFVDPHTRIPPQNTLSMAWTADCLLRLGSSRVGTAADRHTWLGAAQRAVDQLCLYQQLWQPPFLSYRSFGGFGVMNTDGEWSDARQALFALVLFAAARTFGVPEYFHRGVAALRAAFALQAIPENREICPSCYDGSCPNWPRPWEWDFRWDRSPAEMGKLPPGKCVENYGHGGYDSPGVRSGFDWGEGSAATGAMIATERFGDVFVDQNRGWVFGLDGIGAHASGDVVVLDDLLGRGRELRVRAIGGAVAADGRVIGDGDRVRPGTRIRQRR